MYSLELTLALALVDCAIDKLRGTSYLWDVLYETFDGSCIQGMYSLKHTLGLAFMKCTLIKHTTGLALMECTLKKFFVVSNANIEVY